jgi:hypothetical protein
MNGDSLFSIEFPFQNQGFKDYNDRIRAVMLCILYFKV